MALVYVAELWDGRKGSQELNGRHRTYTRVFEVRTDDVTNGPGLVVGATGIPLFGASHPEDAGAIVQKIEPQQHSDDPTLWTVTVGYDSKIDFEKGITPDGATPNSDPQSQSLNPLLQPPTWKMSFQSRERPVRFRFEIIHGDADPTIKVPVLNSAHLPFDPPPMYDDPLPILSVTFNVATWTVTQSMVLRKTVNKTAWRGIPPRCARYVGCETDNAFENGIVYAKVTHHIALNDETWDLILFDCGYFDRDSATGGWAKITDPAGREISEPWPLNGSGKRLTPGDTPVYLPGMRIYREADYNDLIG